MEPDFYTPPKKPRRGPSPQELDLFSAAAAEEHEPEIGLLIPIAQKLAREAGTAGVTVADVREMVCDWWGAGKGYDDPRPWMDSVELNIKNKGQYLTPEQMWLVREVAAFLQHERSQ